MRGEQRHLRSVPPPVSADENHEPPDSEDPDPPEDDVWVLLW
ncbi:hypothetical protein [Mycobacterium sp. shizuoka-1]|nr:hypothetical protein [Mycobacterium sp. shizuoka-1]